MLAGGLTKKTKAEQIAYESKADSPVKAVEAEDHEREVGSGPLFAGRNGGSGDSGGGERGESEDSRGESVFGMFGSVPRNVLPQVFTPVEEQSASPQQSLEETSSTTPAASAAPTEVPASSAANTAADAADAAADDAAADDASGAIITVPVGSPATTAPAEPSITGPFVTSGISWVPEGIGGHYALYHIRVTPQRANAMTVEGVTSRSSRETPCLSEDDSKPFTVYHRFQDFKVLQVRTQSSRWKTLFGRQILKRFFPTSASEDSEVFTFSYEAEKIRFSFELPATMGLCSVSSLQTFDLSPSESHFMLRSNSNFFTPRRTLRSGFHCQITGPVRSVTLIL